MLQDLRLVLRSLRTRPGPTLVAVACLSLGIGANIALFGVVDALLFRPPAGVSHPAGLVRVRVGGAQGLLASEAGPTANYPAYQAVREQRGAVLSGLAAYGGAGGTLGSGTEAQRVDAKAVTGNFFSVLGVRPFLGRFFDAAEGAPRSGATVAVLSYRAWRGRFGGDRRILGRTIEVNGVPLTVIGVAPKGFVGVDLGDPDLWVPMGVVVLPEFGGEGRLGGGSYWLQFVGRLAPGVSFEKAAAMTAPEPAGSPWVAEPVHPRTAGGTEPVVPVTLMPLRTMFFGTPGNRSPIAPWALWISAAVLLLACATVANLLLAEAVRGRRDVAVRLALGGSPGRIVREQVLRSGIIAALSLGGATAFAWVSISLVRRLPIPPIPGVVNARSVAVGAAAALLTPLLFGVVPALWSARRRVGEILKEHGGSSIASVSGLQHALMAAQTAIGFVLLLVAALFVRSLGNVKALDTGLDLDRVLTVRVDLRSLGGGAEPMVEALNAIRRIPGVESAAVGDIVPFYRFAYGTVAVAGRPPEDPPRSVFYNTVGPDYFKTVGARVAAGRPIGPADTRSAPPVAMVSESLAKAEWPDGDALGSCLSLPGAFGDACVEIVGIERGVRYRGPLSDPSMTVYLAAAQVPHGMEGETIFVRARGDDAVGLIPAVSRAVQAIDPSMPFARIQPLGGWLHRILLPWRIGADLFSVLGMLAALLAAVGLYMVVSFIAAQRTRELGIRAALGATRSRLLGFVLRSGLRISGVGLGVGVVLGAGVAALFRNRLYGLTFLDGTTYVEVAGLLLAVTLVASLRPATRASHADPAVVLREE